MQIKKLETKMKKKTTSSWKSISSTRTHTHYKTKKLTLCIQWWMQLSVSTYVYIQKKAKWEHQIPNRYVYIYLAVIFAILFSFSFFMSTFCGISFDDRSMYFAICSIKCNHIFISTWFVWNWCVWYDFDTENVHWTNK